MKKIAMVIMFIAATAGAGDMTARQEWQMMPNFDVSGPLMWTRQGLEPGDNTVAKLVVPCGTGLDWGFAVRVIAPVTWVSWTGSGGVVQTDVEPERIEAGMVRFDQAGTYIIRHVDPGHTMLYVMTTCQP